MQTSFPLGMPRVRKYFDLSDLNKNLPNGESDNESTTAQPSSGGSTPTEKKVAFLGLLEGTQNKSNKIISSPKIGARLRKQSPQVQEGAPNVSLKRKRDDEGAGEVSPTKRPSVQVVNSDEEFEWLLGIRV